MTETPEELGRQIQEAREKQAREEGRSLTNGTLQSKSGNMGSAMRVATDLVAALFVGGLIGFGIDRWFGTKPWGMVIFLFIGFAAGFMNIYKTQVGIGSKIGFAEPTDKKD